MSLHFKNFMNSELFMQHDGLFLSPLFANI